MGNAAGANSWWATRLAKLKDQSADRVSNVGSNAVSEHALTNALVS